MTTIYLIRHGDVKIRKKGKFYGSIDYELNDIGVIQASKLKSYFNEIDIDSIYTSNLSRAVKTTQIVFDTISGNIRKSESLREREFGIFEGMTYLEVKSSYPNMCDLWEKDWVNYCIDDGESYSQFYNRVITFMKNLTANNDKTIAIISHSGVICSAISYLLGMSMNDYWRFKVDKGSVSRIIIDNSGFAYLDLLNYIPK